MTLRDLRLQAGFQSRKSMAEAINTKKYNVDKWESGKAMPKSKNLKTIASVLGVSVEDVLNSLSVRD